MPSLGWKSQPWRGALPALQDFQWEQVWQELWQLSGASAEFRAWCKHWPCATCPGTSSAPGSAFPASFPSLTKCQGEALGSSWGVYSCLGLLLSHASINLGKLQKLRAGIASMGIIPRSVRKAGVGRRLCWCQLSLVVPRTSNGSAWPCQPWLLQLFTSVSIRGPALESTLKCLFPKPSGSMVTLYKYLPNKAILSPNPNSPSSLSHMLFGMNLSLLR